MKPTSCKQNDRADDARPDRWQGGKTKIRGFSRDLQPFSPLWDVNRWTAQEQNRRGPIKQMNEKGEGRQRSQSSGIIKKDIRDDSSKTGKNIVLKETFHT